MERANPVVRPWVGPSCAASRLCAVVLSLITFGMVGCGRTATDEYIQAQERERQLQERQLRDLQDGIRPLVDKCEQLGPPQNLSQPRKVLLLNITGALGKTEVLSGSSLPQDRVGQLSDQDLLVLAVYERKDQPIPNFYEGGVTGYRVEIKFAVIRWPQREALGGYTLSFDPPDRAWVRKGYSPYADWSEGLSRWVEKEFK